MDKRLKILVLIRKFDNYPKHQPKMDMIRALEKQADVFYWHENGNIKDILHELQIQPDFIFHYDIAWGYGLSPKITGLPEIDIPKGCFVIDLHWSPNARITYVRENNIDIIFSATKNPFLKVFPQFSEKFCWLPWSINPDVMKDWKMKKDISCLLMGLVYIDKKNKGKFKLPRNIPPKGRYLFRDKVFEIMKDEPGFQFHPHPGHRAGSSAKLMVNENYAKELNRSKIFYTCGSRHENGGIPVLKFFEAPACRTLLLAEDNEDIKELGFVDGENFVSCTVDNIAEKTKYYLENDEERERITENGYKFVHQHHTNNHRAKKMIDVINKLIAGESW